MYYHAEPTTYFPNRDPRPFLKEEVTAQRELAAVIEPGGTHSRIADFENYCEHFIAGETSAETLYLHGMITYLYNRERLAGTSTIRRLAAFPVILRQYVYIDKQEASYLREDAEYEVARARRA